MSLAFSFHLRKVSDNKTFSLFTYLGGGPIFWAHLSPLTHQAVLLKLIFLSQFNFFFFNNCDYKNNNILKVPMQVKPII